MSKYCIHMRHGILLNSISLNWTSKDVSDRCPFVQVVLPLPVVVYDRCARFRLQISVEVPQLQFPHGVDVAASCSDKLPAVPGGASDLFISKMFKV